MSSKNSNTRAFFAVQSAGLLGYAHYMLAATVLLTACGGDSGSSNDSEPVHNPLSVWMYEDLPECDKSLEGTTMYVETELEHHICLDNQWTLVDESGKDDALDEEDENDLGECTDENEGEVKESAFSIRMELNDFQICEDGSWRSASYEDREKSGWGNAKDRTVRQGEITKSLYKYDEVAHQWIFANMYDTLYGLNGCTQAKNRKVAEGSDGHTYVCDNEWDRGEYFYDRWEWRGESYTEKATGAICNYDDIGKILTSVTEMECLGRGVWKAVQETFGDEDLIDPRDEHVYKTVGIGTQIWMAENLNYESPDSRCYNDSSEYCNQYGRLYTWGAAMDSLRTGCGYGDSCSVAGNNQGICPEGWHLPNEREWYTLDQSLNEIAGNLAGKELKSTTGWEKYNDENGNGTDIYGFNALPSGRWDGMIMLDGAFRGLGTETCYWLSNEGDFLYVPTITYDPEKLAYTRLEIAKRANIYSGREDAVISSAKKLDACAVRCLKD